MIHQDDDKPTLAHYLLLVLACIVSLYVLRLQMLEFRASHPPMHDGHEHIDYFVE